MTAEVGVLNKSCVVLAADSAVTVSNRDNSKVFNRANKVFSLSNKDPVGIMIFNQADFMGVPIETIVKTYRKEETRSFDTLRDHANNFFEWLRNNKSFFPEDLQNCTSSEYFGHRA